MILLGKIHDNVAAQVWGSNHLESNLHKEIKDLKFSHISEFSWLQYITDIF